jgi:LuxR family maltose regulon positive regulatory protein
VAGAGVGRPVAWLTLTEAENDQVVLCSHLVEAVRAVWPRFGAELRAMLTTPAPALDEALRLFANGMAAGESLALVLDDFNRVTSPDAVEVIAWLAENCPVSLQLVVASRADPMLPLAALRAHGELVELRAAELALTEGWPAGLYLAALSASHARDPRRFIQMFGASSGHVVDFFIDEVLRRQPRRSADLHDALLDP